jgi:hypothetical protein
MKGKLTKEEKRHLDDARREKQVKEHAVQQAQELPPVYSSSRPRKPGLLQRLPPLKLLCPPPRYIVYALESQTKSDLLDRTPTPARPARVSGVQPPSGPGSSGGGPSSRPPTKKRRAPLHPSSSPGSSSQPSAERKGLFFSAEYAGKVTMIDDMARLWGLPPHITPAGTPESLEEGQVRFMEVDSLLPMHISLAHTDFELTYPPFGCRVLLTAFLPCAPLLPLASPRRSCCLFASESRIARRRCLHIRIVPGQTGARSESWSGKCKKRSRSTTEK